jgi:uncharacterized protein (TIGR02118 family)
MTAELVVLYTQPQDPHAFEQHFADRHIQLMDELPGLLSWRRSRFVAAADMLEHTYYGSTTLEFGDVAALTRAMESDEGKLTVDDFHSFAPPNSRIFIARPQPPATSA